MAVIPKHLRINESSPFGNNRKMSARQTKMGAIVGKIKSSACHTA